jgi:hypothetical protein
MHGREYSKRILGVNPPMGRASGPPSGLIRARVSRQCTSHRCGERVQDLDDTPPDLPRLHDLLCPWAGISPPELSAGPEAADSRSPDQETSYFDFTSGSS